MFRHLPALDQANIPPVRFGDAALTHCEAQGSALGVTGVEIDVIRAPKRSPNMSKHSLGFMRNSGAVYTERCGMICRDLSSSFRSQHSQPVAAVAALSRRCAVQSEYFIHVPFVPSKHDLLY